MKYCLDSQRTFELLVFYKSNSRSRDRSSFSDAKKQNNLLRMGKVLTIDGDISLMIEEKL